MCAKRGLGEPPGICATGDRGTGAPLVTGIGVRGRGGEQGGTTATSAGQPSQTAPTTQRETVRWRVRGRLGDTQGGGCAGKVRRRGGGRVGRRQHQPPLQPAGRTPTAPAAAVRQAAHRLAVSGGAVGATRGDPIGWPAGGKGGTPKRIPRGGGGDIIGIWSHLARRAGGRGGGRPCLRYNHTPPSFSPADRRDGDEAQAGGG